ncbi:MAG TPA: OmpA family protein [Myxococcota bacterium]
MVLCASAAHGQPAPAPATAPADAKEFVIHKSEHPTANKASQIKATATEAALRLTVVAKDTAAGIAGVVVCLTGPDGKKYYADETGADGYTELLVPISQTYQITYLSLGRSDVTAKATVDDKPNHNINLTLRFQRYHGTSAAPRVVLEGVYFDTGNAKLRPESMPRLDTVLEYMAHKQSARIEISGHTDNVGEPKANKDLSQRRAQVCRDYLVSKGIDTARIVVVGYGEERPIASNDTDDGRQKNRRIEATEL